VQAAGDAAGVCPSGERTDDFGGGAARADRERGGLGCYGWDGGLGTSWLVDPVHDLVVIVLT
jgi:CubicO group peptidase (beta-lactamase class C family)